MNLVLHLDIPVMTWAGSKIGQNPFGLSLATSAKQHEFAPLNNIIMIFVDQPENLARYFILFGLWHIFRAWIIHAIELQYLGLIPESIVIEVVKGKESACVEVADVMFLCPKSVRDVISET
jgi:hypothetical protein